MFLALLLLLLALFAIATMGPVAILLLLLAFIVGLVLFALGFGAFLYFLIRVTDKLAEWLVKLLASLVSAVLKKDPSDSDGKDSNI